MLRRAGPALLLLVMVPMGGAVGQMTPVRDLRMAPHEDGILLTWSPPASAGSGDLVAYTVERWTGGEACQGAVLDPSPCWADPVWIGAEQTHFEDQNWSVPSVTITFTGYRVSVHNSEGEVARASVFGLVTWEGSATTFECTYLEVRTSTVPPGVILNGICLIDTATQPLPAEHHPTVREPLYAVWGNVHDAITTDPSTHQSQARGLL
jgi:hypothetical protein